MGRTWHRGTVELWEEYRGEGQEILIGVVTALSKKISSCKWNGAQHNPLESLVLQHLPMDLLPIGSPLSTWCKFAALPNPTYAWQESAGTIFDELPWARNIKLLEWASAATPPRAEPSTHDSCLRGQAWFSSLHSLLVVPSDNYTAHKKCSILR